MASVKDALEETLQDNLSWFKYVLYTIPVFYVVYNIIQGKNSQQLPVIIILTILLLAGFMLKCTYNVRMGNRNILPSFNIFGVLWLGLKGAIALAPMSAIAYFGSLKVIEIISLYIPVSGIYYFFVVCSCAIFSSFIFTSYLLFTKNFKIIDAYNIKLIFNNCVDILISVLLMFLFVAIIAAIMAAPVTYLVWLFMGLNNPVIIFIWCMIGVICIGIMGHYLAQVEYEILASAEEKDKVSK